MLKSTGIMAVAVGIAALTATAVRADDSLRLGFLAPQSGPPAVIGEEMRNALDLAIEDLGGKVGGMETEVFAEDSKFDPGEAVQQASKLMDRDEVQIVTGLAASNVLMAVAKPLLARGTIVVGANAGPSPLAGENCHENLFVTSFQNDQWSLGIGRYMTDAGVDKAYFMGMNYQAGWDHTKAVIRNFGGKVVGEVYTPVKQLDFSAELTQLRAAQPDAVYAFYVGGAAIAFLKQFTQAGLKASVALYSMTAMSDPTLFNAQGDAAVGLKMGTHWSPQFDNPQNRKFVEGYEAKYGRTPTAYAANQYDAVMLIDGAIKKAGGVNDIDAFRVAMRSAPFESVRGKFRFNNNHFPIQDIYMEEVAKDEEGKLYKKLIGKAGSDVKDPYHGECSMSW